MNLTRRHFCGLACGAAALGAAGCAVNPATGQRNLMLVSRDREEQLGRQEHPKILKEFGGAYDDGGLARYVQEVGRRLAAVTETPGTRFTFTLLDNPIVNAFAAPGGYVYVSRGLLALADNEAELAGVLGHELGHVVARHTAQRISKATLFGAVSSLLGAGQVGETLGAFYLSSFSRDQELEADRLAVRYIGRAGYDPDAMTTFLSKMRANSRLEAEIAGRDPDDIDARDFMSTHPRTIERVRQLAGTVAGRGVVDREAYLSRIDNMVYGDSPHHGLVRGQDYYDLAAPLAFRVPAGFRLVNAPESVAAIGGQPVQILFDSADEPYHGDMTGYIRDKLGSDLTLGNERARRLSGLPSATASTVIETRGGRLEARVAAIRFDQRRIYRFLAVALPGNTGPLNGAFESTLASFRKLGAAEAAAVRPWRIRIARVAGGDTVYGLSRRMPFTDFADARFRVLNGLEPGEPLIAGSMVKLVAVR